LYGGWSKEKDTRLIRGTGCIWWLAYDSFTYNVFRYLISEITSGSITFELWGWYGCLGAFRGRINVPTESNIIDWTWRPRQTYKLNSFFVIYFDYFSFLGIDTIWRFWKIKNVPLWLLCFPWTKRNNNILEIWFDCFLTLCFA